MVKKWDVTIPTLPDSDKRKVYVCLPQGYRDRSQRRYPVLYMFDGHNVFFDSDATYGKCWGMKEYMERSRKELIVVAVECNHRGNGRLREYAPFDFENDTLGAIRGEGKIYMDWLVGVLKPYIDQTYRTLPDRAHTLIGGSSMGGLMALYGATAYNRVFQRAACLSPSLWVDRAQVLKMIADARMENDTCIYMDYGSVEIYNHTDNAEALIETAHLLLKKRVDLTLRIIPGGTHSEASWEKQIPIFMECLGI
ncbi:MAG: alpha/beta hydrolase [Oscillospiraceae bacterium]|nr:alpha/beta hydrolase [Oscillospiraceae bacterium]